jgi:AraC-like DNA-binding protein
MHTLAEGVAFETLDAFMCFLVRLFRLLYKPDLKPVSVKLARPCPAGYEAQYEKSLHAPITFDAPYCEISLEQHVVDEPLIGGIREIAHHNDQIIEGYLETLDKEDIVTRVKKFIIQDLSSGRCSKKRVAEQMLMSQSALQLKLTERGSTFQDLRDQVRKSLALSYIEQGHISITEISFLLGFTDTSNFSRAFRRWTGKSPTVYRGGTR